MNVKRLDPEGKDKLARATPALIFCEAGRLWLPAPGEAPGYPWDAAAAELLAFTGDGKADEHDDTVRNFLRINSRSSSRRWAHRNTTSRTGRRGCFWNRPWLTCPTQV